MDATDANPRATKALKRENATSIHSNMRSLAHVETVMHRVLQFLPLPSLYEFLGACGETRDFEWTLQDSHLWTELLELHFGGSRQVTEDTALPSSIHDDIDDEDEDGDNSDDDNSDDDGDEEEDERDDGASEQTAAANSQTEVQASANSSVTEETAAASDAAANPELATTTIDLENINLPTWFDAKNACEEAREFVVSMVEWKQFSERVTVVRGDIGVIEQLNGRAIDAIAFPGNNSCSNAHNGSSGVMFRRAGAQMEQFTRQNSVYLQPGQSRVTPGFNAGVRVIIHCHGPYRGYANTFGVLAQTYRSVLTNAMDESVDCLAMASISTGNHALPIEQSTQTAVRAIQKFMRLHHSWQGHVGVVCYDGDVLAAFQSKRERVLSHFNASD